MEYRIWNIGLKIVALVASYLAIVVSGIFLSFPELSEAILKHDSVEIFAYEVDDTLPNNIEVQAISTLIVPHHIVADKQIRDGMAHAAAARKNLKTRRIILMGPNHFFRGKAQVITTEKIWHTNYGDLIPDTDFIERLTEKNLAVLEEGIAEGDHSITALLPFVERFFPDAEFVPLLIREPMKRSDTQTLARFFHQNLTEEDLIIASIDFAHYVPKEVADKYDAASLKALKTLDIDFFEKKIEADARQILMVLADFLRLQRATRPSRSNNASALYRLHRRSHAKQFRLTEMRPKGATFQFTLLAHTNSAVLMANPAERSTTSHFVVYYAR